MVAKKYPDMILKFGGHAAAAGLSISSAMLEDFRQAFEEVAKVLLDENTLTQKLVHDGELDVEYMNPELAQSITDQIWGQGFPEPVFTGRFKVLKQNLLKNKHLKLELQALSSTQNRSPQFSAIWFNHSDLLATKTQLAYKLQIDNYLSYPRLQLIIEAEHSEN
jgi:single-stranded-DNA-specific exonuclease